ncbi:hypothetical protein Btru_073165 [Bulinus truncatus]|nr:hypothetical protein Btru_073165 [Bulinus truncatus]
MTSSAVPCNDTKCQTSLSHDLNISISSLLTSIDYYKGTFVDPLDDLTSNLPRSRLTIVTAASSNHFLEVQGLIKSLHENVFQKMSNISFYIYDLGLNRFELHQLKQFCRCQTISYPFHLIPKEVNQVKCYTWKPLIIQAHLKLSDTVIWADASVRLLPLDDNFFQDVRDKGLLISLPSRFYRPISHHTDARTFDYFHIVPCSVTSYQELEATIIAFHQQPFITDLVTYAWALCALDANCMCPTGSVTNIRCDHRVRKYSKCHRFDQSVITLILLKLFHDNYSTFRFDPVYFLIKRSEAVQYFDTLISANKNKSLSD